MDEIDVRRALVADVDAVIDIFQDGDNLHRDALPWLFRKADDGAVADFLKAYILKADHAMFLAVTKDGSLAGVVYMYVRQPGQAPIVKPAVVAEIDALVVATGFRRQRIGTRLFEAARRWAIESGATRTELGVFEFNEDARAFWAAVGFQTLSRRLVLHANPEG